MTDASKQAECVTAIAHYFEHYQDNAYMKDRIHKHIVHNLSNLLSNECKNHERRENLVNYLREEQQIFMQVFLSKHRYYYLSTNECFYEYNGVDYCIVKEDDILHKLLSSISKDRVLLPWKHKTKIALMRQIKERPLFSCIPESTTIQHVLTSLYPSIFPSKTAAKYFLTIVGDHLLSKRMPFTFLVSPKLKELVQELDVASLQFIQDDSPSSNFVTKYHLNHDFETIRLLKIHEEVSLQHWREMLKKIGLNLLCVAAHYSTRYQNSDHFLQLKSDEEFSSYVFMLKNITKEDIVLKFKDTCLTPQSESKLEWKNVWFVWKQFLAKEGMPNVVFSSILKTMLSQYFVYDEPTDCLLGVTSQYLPFYKDFLSFWETTIEQTSQDTFEYEYELDELSSLFKTWSHSRTTLSEECILQMLRYYFHDIQIRDDKFVIQIKCRLWDKIGDLNASLPYLKECIQHCSLALVSFDDMYMHYQTYCQQHGLKYVVSKRYFEKYLYHRFEEWIVYEKFMKVEWVLSI